MGLVIHGERKTWGREEWRLDRDQRGREGGWASHSPGTGGEGEPQVERRCGRLRQVGRGRERWGADRHISKGGFCFINVAH